MADKPRYVLFAPLFNDNPIALQILGICSAVRRTAVSFQSSTSSNGKASPGSGKTGMQP